MSAVFSRRPWGRNECVTNEPQRTSAGTLETNVQLENTTVWVWVWVTLEEEIRARNQTLKESLNYCVLSLLISS